MTSRGSACCASGPAAANPDLMDGSVPLKRCSAQLTSAALQKTITNVHRKYQRNAATPPTKPSLSENPRP